MSEDLTQIVLSKIFGSAFSFFENCPVPSFIYNLSFNNLFPWLYSLPPLVMYKSKSLSPSTSKNNAPWSSDALSFAQGCDKF